MRKLLAILVSIAVSSTAVLATNGIKGSLTWVGGTLNADITITATPQTVVMKVGSTTKTFTNTYIPGQPGDVISAGTPFELLAANSNPFAATFTTLNVVVKNNYDGYGITGDKSVPITAAGAIGGNIGFPIDSYSPGLQLFYPAFTINNLSFPNGMDANFGVSVGSYNLAIPNASTVTTIANVNFPATSLPVNTFDFQASGNGNVYFEGISTTNTVAVAGNVSGTATTFTAASFTISNRADTGAGPFTKRKN